MIKAGDERGFCHITVCLSFSGKRLHFLSNYFRGASLPRTG
jgi:hypothetical protein